MVLVAAGLSVPVVTLRVPPDWDGLALPPELEDGRCAVVDDYEGDRAWLQEHIVALEMEVDALALELKTARGDQSVARTRNAQLEQRLDEAHSRMEKLSADLPSVRLRNAEGGLFPLDWVK